MLRMELRSGLDYLPGYFSREAQEALVNEVLTGLSQAPLFTPTMPRTGKPMSVRMSNFGALGWVSDVKGYRYQEHHPETKNKWPNIPQVLLELWKALAPDAKLPEACLINHYVSTAKMGLHQDKDEADFTAPVISISLGDEAVFRFKGVVRTGPSMSIRLKSGDVLLMGGESRLSFHGVDRIIPQSSKLLSDTPLREGRINLTLRRVND